MTDRPILFSGAMVRALLAGTKTQTRRLVNARDAGAISEAFFYADRETFAQLNSDPSRFLGIRCPYGAPGDRLWVRETWRVGAWRDDGRMALDFAASPDLVRTPWLKPPREAFRRLHVQGLADCRRALARGALSLEEHSDGRFSWPHGVSPCRWRPSIHMPRWASRLTLEVTGVRVERLQDISEEDALREGIDDAPVNENVGGSGGFGRRFRNYDESDPTDTYCVTARESFRSLWESINGAESWASNPWVWVVAFKRVTP